MKKLFSLFLVVVLLLIMMPAGGLFAGHQYGSPEAGMVTISPDDIEEDISEFDILSVTRDVDGTLDFTPVTTGLSFINFIKSEAVEGTVYVLMPKSSGWYYYKRRTGDELVPRYGVLALKNSGGTVSLGGSPNGINVVSLEHDLRQNLTVSGKYKFFFDGYTDVYPYREMVGSGDMTLYSGKDLFLNYEYNPDGAKLKMLYETLPVKAGLREITLQDVKSKLTRDYSVYLVSLNNTTPRIVDPELSSFVDFDGYHTKLSVDEVNNLFFTDNFGKPGDRYFVGRKGDSIYAKVGNAAGGILIIEGDLDGGDYQKRAWGLIAGSELYGNMRMSYVEGAGYSDYLLGVPNVNMKSRVGFFLHKGEDNLYNRANAAEYKKLSSFYHVYLYAHGDPYSGSYVAARPFYNLEASTRHNKLLKNMGLSYIYKDTTKGRVGLGADLRTAKQSFTFDGWDSNSSDEIKRFFGSLVTNKSVSGGKIRGDFRFDASALRWSVSSNTAIDSEGVVREFVDNYGSGGDYLHWASSLSASSSLRSLSLSSFSDRWGIKKLEPRLEGLYDTGFFSQLGVERESSGFVELYREGAWDDGDHVPSVSGQPQCGESFIKEGYSVYDVRSGVFLNDPMYGVNDFSLEGFSSFDIVRHHGSKSAGTFRVEVLDPGDFSRGGKLAWGRFTVDGDYVVFPKMSNQKYYHKLLSGGTHALRYAIPFHVDGGKVYVKSDIEGFPYIDRVRGVTEDYTGSVVSLLSVSLYRRYDSYCGGSSSFSVSFSGFGEVDMDGGSPTPPVPPVPPVVVPPVVTPPAPPVPLVPYVPEGGDVVVPKVGKPEEPKGEEPEPEAPVVPEVPEPSTEGDGVPPVDEIVNVIDPKVPQSVVSRIPNRFEGTPFHIVEEDKDYIFLWDDEIGLYTFDRVDDIPQGSTVLPQTDGLLPVYFYMLGGCLLCFGLMMRKFR